MVKELLITEDDWEVRGALLEDGVVVELFFERNPAKFKVGNIYLGRVKDVLPGMEAAFIDIGQEKNAFLFFRDDIYTTEQATPTSIESIRKNQHILVQIIKQAMKGKGAKATTRVGLAGHFAVLLPFSQKIGISRKIEESKREELRQLCEKIRMKDFGFIIRTAATDASIRNIRNELSSLKRTWLHLNRKMSKASPPVVLYEELGLELRLIRDLFSADFKSCIIGSPPLYKKIKRHLNRTDPLLINRIELYEEPGLFEKFNIDKVVKEATERTVSLKSGGYIAIDHTEALTAIDVNTGRYTGRRNLEETIFKTNLEAANEIARQLRLRDIGGIIVIDFIGMKRNENQEKLFAGFSKAIERDRSKSHIVQLSPLGLVEMTRKSVSESMLELKSETCTYCGGTGLIVSSESSAIDVQRQIRKICLTLPAAAFLVKIHPLVAAEIGMAQGDHIRDRETGKSVFFALDFHLPINGIELLNEGKVKDVVRSVQMLGA
jgi:ribonuclease G